MTDSFDSIGSAEVLDHAINWGTPPSIEFLGNTSLVDFNFTSQEMYTETDYTPFRGQHSFALTTREEEYNFLDFFLTKRGRWKRFWAKSVENSFTLKSNVSNGSSVIYVYDNRFDRIAQGTERIWIKLLNGDEYIRWVNDVTRNVTEDRLELSLETLVLNGFDIEDVAVFGRAYLVRCDIDEYNFNYRSNIVSEVTVRIQEVPEEYDDV